MVILGISLGTTTAGIAIIEDKELVHWQTHSFRAVWSENKANDIVTRLERYFWQHHIQIVVIKLPPRSHQPPTVVHLLKKIMALCEYKGCMTTTCTKKDLKQHIPTAKNHGDIMRFVVEQYPIVTPEYVRATKRKNHYHKKLFEAVIAAHVESKKHR